MRLLLRLVFFPLLSVVAGVSLAQQSTSNCDRRDLPVDVSGVLKTQFAGWRVKTIEDLDAYERKLWTHSKLKQCPGIAIGHFFNPTDQAVALLLVPEHRGSNGFKVVVFSKLKGKLGVASTVIEESKDQLSTRIVIYRVPPGLYKDPENTRKVRITLDGIQVEEMEAGSSVYFWRNGRFENLLTSE